MRPDLHKLGWTMAALVSMGCAREAAASLSDGHARNAQLSSRAALRVLFVSDGTGHDGQFGQSNRRPKAGVTVSSCLVGADSGHFEGLVPLPLEPKDFETFDVLVLGDVTLPGGAAARARWFELLDGFVRRGGGVAFVCGERIPDLYRGTAMEQMLPVVLTPITASAPDAVRTAGTVSPVRSALPHPFLDLVANGPIGEAFATLSPIDYRPIALQLAPKAQALLVDEDQLVNDEPAIVVASLQHDKGRTLWIGTDEIFRWRDPHGDVYTARFWHNVVRWLGGDSDNR